MFSEFMNINGEKSHQIVYFLEILICEIAKTLSHSSTSISFRLYLPIQGEDGEIGPRGLAGESVRLTCDL